MRLFFMIMKLMYATTNQAKFQTMKEAFDDTKIELSFLSDIKIGGDAPETGKTALENAILKAKYYYHRLQIPLFSCDTSLEIENVPEYLKPGVNVRRVNGKTLSDDEMIRYYGNLAEKFGKLKCRYRNAICLIVSEQKIFASDDDKLSSNYFYIHEKPLRLVVKGFPLDCLSESSTATSMKPFVDFIFKNICL